MKARTLLVLTLAGSLLAGSSFAHAQSVLPDEYDEEAVEEEEEEEEEEVEEVEREEEVRAARRSKWTAKDRRASSGLGFELTLGALATYRRMRFAGTDAEIKHRPGPYFGGAIRGSQRLFTSKTTKSQFLVEGEGGFGSAKNAEVEPTLGRRLVTEHAYLHVLGVLEKPIHPAVDLRFGLGAGALSFTVEPNPAYTGHRYLSVVASFGAAYWLSDRVRVTGNVIFFPGLKTNQSANGYGAARSFGGRGELMLGWRFFQPEEGDLFGSADFGARYSFSRFRTSMPETQVLGDLAGTDDSQHAVVLAVSYHL